MMDCDTTGIEPDLALVKYKKLVGGGLIKIVNNTVPAALMKLGYTPEQTSEIVSYIDKEAKWKARQHFKAEHLPVFDCSLAAPGGRSIAWTGHVRMMAAAQPFLPARFRRRSICRKNRRFKIFRMRTWNRGSWG